MLLLVRGDDGPTCGSGKVEAAPSLVPIIGDFEWAAPRDVSAPRLPIVRRSIERSWSDANLDRRAPMRVHQERLADNDLRRHGPAKRMRRRLSPQNSGIFATLCQQGDLGDGGKLVITSTTSTHTDGGAFIWPSIFSTSPAPNRPIKIRKIRIVQPRPIQPHANCCN